MLLHEVAKSYTNEKNSSLSDIIEIYLKTLTYEHQTFNMVINFNPTVESLKGSFKILKNMLYKKEFKYRLENKYLYRKGN
nr:DUF6364 family protein [Arenibacter sp. NBRC 103722]